jgi:hypothetical protein
VVTQDRDDRNPDGCGELLRQDDSLLLETVIRQVAAQEEHIRVVVHRCEQRLQLSLRRLFDVEVANRG